MKNVLAILAVTVAFASCGGGESKETKTDTVKAVTVDTTKTVTVDTTKKDTTAKPAADTAVKK
ncbi:hypothetical protein ACI6Q2_09795 [Chitinophagaceae bacterium LWZ2-11]